jgi:hypothetical protein
MPREQDVIVEESAFENTTFELCISIELLARTDNDTVQRVQRILAVDSTSASARGEGK